MTVSSFISALLVMSTATSLITEALKKTIGAKINFSSNILAAIVSVLVAVFGSCGYMIYKSAAFTSQTLIMVALLTVCTWLCAMLGYDKIKQAIEQCIGE